MHVSRPIRFPEDRPESTSERPRALSSVVLAAIVFATVAVVASLVLTTHGVVLPCGEDMSVTCTIG